MISLPFRRSPQDPTIDALYGMIVAQARSPSFYRSYGVPDTVSGRFDMIVLHLVLLLGQLRDSDDAAAPVSQRLFDRFCRDMDDNFREMGVGDLAVPKQMRKVAEAYYGRAKAYDRAIADNDVPALEAALARNVFDVVEPPLGAKRLAAYMREVVCSLDIKANDAVSRADVRFPDPESVAAPQA